MKAHQYHATLAVLVLALLSAGIACAHCDTMDGPVVAAATNALGTGDITPILKWISAKDEPEIRTAFTRTLAVRAKGAEAKELADQWFFETLVRMHRAGEGAPYTGLKPHGSVEPIVQMADKALESGSVDELVKAVNAHIAAGIRERFARAAAAAKQADKSVAAGREFVEAYIAFMHYVEGAHTAAAGGAAHGAESEGAAACGARAAE